MLINLLAPDAGKYGVFAAMVAVAGMIIAAVAGLARMWRGPLNGWEVPEQPPFANRLGTLPAALLMVIGFIFAKPENLWIVVGIGAVLVAISAVTGIIYSQQIVSYRRVKKVPSGDKETRDVPVLAGDELTEWARTTMKAKNLDDQGVFAGTPNDPYVANLVWTPESRKRVYNRLSWLFIVALFCGTGALSWLAYAVEMKVTGRAAADILNTSQIPTDGSKK